MEDLVQSQIYDSCKLALPNGLKDLMSDISREVLRAQPKNLYDFIVKYLSALLVTRDNLSIASRICADIRNGVCDSDLDDELRALGLDEEHIEKAMTVIKTYFEKEQVNEGNLLVKLTKMTDIEEEQLPAIQDAVRRAFLRNQAEFTYFDDIYTNKKLANKDGDEVKQAVDHTLKLYQKTSPQIQEYNQMAEKIQASYKAYGVRRHNHLGDAKEEDSKKTDKCIHFETDVKKVYNGNKQPKPLTTVSSTSLAGSYMHLPKYKPYSVHSRDTLVELEEVPEKENANIDYTLENRFSNNSNIFTDATKTEKKTISFHNLPVEILVNNATESGIDFAESVEEDIGGEDIAEEVIEEITRGDVNEEMDQFSDEEVEEIDKFSDEEVINEVFSAVIDESDSTDDNPTN